MMTHYFELGAAMSGRESEHAVAAQKVSTSQRVRELLLSGQLVNQSAVSEEFGCSTSLLAIVRKGLEEAGYEFESFERREGRKVFVDWQLVRTKPKGKTSEEKVAEVEQVEAPSKNGTPLPVLGQTVTVSLLSMSDSGVISIGLRDGSKTWLCQLVGQTK
jgi:hypothetical protein